MINNTSRYLYWESYASTATICGEYSCTGGAGYVQNGGTYDTACTTGSTGVCDDTLCCALNKCGAYEVCAGAGYEKDTDEDANNCLAQGCDDATCCKLMTCDNASFTCQTANWAKKASPDTINCDAAGCADAECCEGK